MINYRLSTFFIVLLFATSCVQQDDYDIPDTNVPTVHISGKRITIEALKNEFDTDKKTIITYSNTDAYIEGYVVSSDEAGNFFKEIVLQDLPKDPTAGIQLLIDQRSLSQHYDFGRKIYVKLNGLSLGLDHGVLKLGKLKEGAIEAISSFEIEKFLIRSPEISKIIPKQMTIENFDQNSESLYIKIDEVQFQAELLGANPKTFAGEASDQFQGEREIYHCQTGASTLVSTSTFADFKSVTLPKQQGSLEGILTKDFQGKYYILKLNDHTGLVFNQKERCDLDFLACTPTLVDGNTILFEENFETIKKDAQLDDLGWTNVNINGDDKRWGNKKIVNVANRVMRISAFNTGLNPLETWLITPGIDMDHTHDETLVFTVQSTFNNGKALTLWVTNSYTGDPKSTTWTPLDVAIPFKNANKVTLRHPVACLDGELNIAFRYAGRDPGATSTYTIDDIMISGKLQ